MIFLAWFRIKYAMGAHTAVMRAEAADIHNRVVEKFISFEKAQKTRAIKSFLNPTAISTRKNCPFGSFILKVLEKTKNNKNMEK